MEKIIDYVNETPYNTNIGILKDKLRKYSNELMNNAVKSVNGNKPDDTGNVEIEIPEGFSGSWDDLEGKPFYDETYIGEPLTLDYVYGFRNLEEGVSYKLIGTDDEKTDYGVFKFSEGVLTREDGVKCTVFLTTMVVNGAPYPAYKISIEGYELEEFPAFTAIPYIRLFQALPEKFLPEHKHNWEKIENRPFYEEDIEENIVEEIKLQANTDYEGVLSGTETLAEGDKVFVEYDGVVYECGVGNSTMNPGTTYHNGYAIGDPSWIETGYSYPGAYLSYYGPYPFVLTTLNFSDGATGETQKSYQLYTVAGDTDEHTIRVYTVTGTEIHPLPSKFLPSHTHSWEQIENPPFGEEVVETIIIEPKALIYDVDYGAALASVPEFILNEGEIYTVEFDGVKYENLEVGYGANIYDCNYYYIGNPNVNTNVYYSGGDEKNPNANRADVPFCVMCTSSRDPEYRYVVAVEEENEHTISVYQSGTEITTLDPKFLPEIDSGNFIVNFTHDGDTITSNKTIDEILSAIESGKNVVGKSFYNGASWQVLRLSEYGTEGSMQGKYAEFTTVTMGEYATRLTIYSYVFSNTGKIIFHCKDVEFYVA